MNITHYSNCNISEAPPVHITQAVTSLSETHERIVCLSVVAGASNAKFEPLLPKIYYHM